MPLSLANRRRRIPAHRPDRLVEVSLYLTEDIIGPRLFSLARSAALASRSACLGVIVRGLHVVIAMCTARTGTLYFDPFFYRCQKRSHRLALCVASRRMPLH